MWDHLGSNVADIWFADQLIESVGLGARDLSRKTPISTLYGKNLQARSGKNFLD